MPFWEDLDGDDVSILSQPEGRELQERIWAVKFDTLGFNPLPARRPGATPYTTCHNLLFQVSILSQPEGRELQF